MDTKGSRCRFIIGCVLQVLFLLSGIAGDAGVSAWAESSAQDATVRPAALQSLSEKGVVTLRSFMDAGNLPDLRWPNFADYRVHVRNFYEPVGYALSWVRQGKATSQAAAIIEVLQDADSKGLNAEDYDGPRWAARLAALGLSNRAGAETDSARFDLALTVSVMRYISDLHIGRVNPRQFDFGLDTESKKYNLPEFLRQRLVDKPDPKAVLAEVEPGFEGYRRMQKALATYLDLADKDDGELLPVTKEPVEPGDNYPGVPRLARLLRLLGDLPAEAVVPADSTVYQGPLVDAVKRFQGRHGLDRDGWIGRQTVSQLNTPLNYRVRQMKLTLERWRWLPQEFRRLPIVVNIPEFRLRGLNEQNKEILEMRVVVGEAFRHQTPVFAEEMRYVVFRPYWNVPPSIQRSELVPKTRKDRAYLATHSYEVVDPGGRVVCQGAVNDEILEQLRTGRLSIRQKPGPKNALGLVKFIFPNEHNVYLHSTPAPELFSRSRRDFSHGCIRVENPLALALLVLRDKPEWTQDRIEAAMNGDKELQVNLDTPIPVLILYATSIVKEHGEVLFFQDIYGHDAALEKVLAKGYPYPG
jgi:L,D-transpeptidase YcbB